MKDQDLTALHSEAMKRYAASFAAEREERDNCLDDIRFCWVKGSQWESSATESRKDRPRMEINKVKLPVSQVCGEQQQNRTTIKIRPDKNGASEEVATALNGLTRAILEDSKFNSIKDAAFKEQTTGGMGGWYVTTEYEENSFNQVIKIKQIVSAASAIYYDPAATDLLKEDAQWFMVTEDIAREDFQARWPDASTSNLASPDSGISTQWQSRDTVRIADYWVKEPCMKELALMSDGSVLELTPETKSIVDELAMEGITTLETRKQPSHKIKMYKISAGQVLEGPFEWAGKYIPVVPLFGYSNWIDGQHYYQGMVRSAVDAQRIYNYAISAGIESVALSPKDPYWVTKNQVKGLESQYANFNNTNNPFMVYNADPEAPGAPQRTGAPSVQSALIGQVQQADMDIQSTTGLYSPSLGQEQKDQSGKAIMALQTQSQLSTYELLNNLTKAIEHTGKILIDLVPKIYDTERTVNIKLPDGSTETLDINKRQIVDLQTGREVVINDLSKGIYSLIASTGPSFESQRAENINILTRLGESNPALAPLMSDLITSSLDNEMSEELTTRVRGMMIQQGLIQPDEEEAQLLNKGPDPIQQLQIEREVLQNELLKVQIENTKAATGKQLSNIDQDNFDRIETLVDSQETISKSLKNKVDASKTLDEMGIDANIPIEGEIEASGLVQDAIDQFYEDTNSPTTNQ